MITMTENATKAIGRFIKNSETPTTGLRVSVSGGGCSGLQYRMSLEESAHEDDAVVESDGVKLFVDALSIPMLQGTQIDFVETLEESGFKFVNPNATASCNCGSSFAT